MSSYHIVQSRLIECFLEDELLSQKDHTSAGKMNGQLEKASRLEGPESLNTQREGRCLSGKFTVTSLGVQGLPCMGILKLAIGVG